MSDRYIRVRKVIEEGDTFATAVLIDSVGRDILVRVLKSDIRDLDVKRAREVLMGRCINPAWFLHDSATWIVEAILEAALGVDDEE